MRFDDKDAKADPSRQPAMERVAPVTTAALELKAMLFIYDRLIAALNEGCDEGLDILIDRLSRTATRCREAVAGELEEQAGQRMVGEMRSELREFPQTLRSLLPGIGPRLGESLESRLGIQFSRF